MKFYQGSPFSHWDFSQQFRPFAATEPPEVDTNGNVMGERATPGEGAALSLPLRTTENFTLDAITESSAEAVEADKLAKQLANPIASLISVPFQANEDCQPVPQQNFED